MGVKAKDSTTVRHDEKPQNSVFLDSFWIDRLDSIGDTVPVGSYRGGASPYGVLDMAGNAWEWVSDRFSGFRYAQTP